jgi:DNA-binding transcriptional ArsR family regulator
MAQKRDGLTVEQAADLFRLLGEPNRLRIALLLAQAGELHVRELFARLGLSEAVASSHLQRLRRGGVADFRKDGRHHYYRLAAPAVADLLRLTCDPDLLEKVK